MKNKIKELLVSICIILICFGATLSVKADELVITATDAVLYSTENAGIYVTPDLEGELVTRLSADLPIKVIGITNNGWFQVNVNGIYYMKGQELKTPTYIDGKPYLLNKTEIEKITAGTYSFYSNKELQAFKTEDIDKMDDNLYIKYLDSYLRLDGSVDNCRIKDSGIALSEYAKGVIEADPSLSGKSNKELLFEYRMGYLEKSFTGPHRTQKALELCVTRAIRYDVSSFMSKWKNASVGSNENKIEDILQEVTELIRREQGIKVTYTKEYKDEYWFINFDVE